MQKKMKQAAQSGKSRPKTVKSVTKSASVSKAAPKRVAPAPKESGVEKFMDFVSPNMSKIRKFGK